MVNGMINTLGALIDNTDCSGVQIGDVSRKAGILGEKQKPRRRSETQ